MIAPDTLELIRSRLDIAELVGESVQLTRAGRNLKGRCPFHQERTPSFIVSPERQTFHCFGCGEGGDAFSFVMKTEGLSFVEAAEKLAERVGVKIEAARELSPQDKDRLRLKEALELAAEHYHALLMKDPAAEAARKYVGSRHLNKDSVDGFRIGYAPRNGNLVPVAKKKGFTDEILLKAGLAAKRPDGSLRDYFFDRLMFPIRDAKGSVVGFGGRTLGDGEPKYLNTPETPVFSKGRLLYGLHEGAGAVRKSRRAHLMEGYMDVIAAHQHGLTSACAPLGTALTPEQAALVKRYADAVTLVFDADAAGQNAAVRGAEVALAAGLSVRVAAVPEGKDPDELLHKRGLPALTEALDAAVDPVAFKTELLIARAGELTPEAKSAVAKDVMGLVVRVPDEVLKDEWVRRLAARLGVNEDSLRRLGGKAVVQRTAAASQRRAEAALPRDVAPSSAPARPSAVSGDDLKLLTVLFKTPESAAGLAEDAFDGAAARSLAANLAACGPYDKGWGPRLLERLEPAERALASRLLADEVAFDDPAGLLRSLVARRARVRRLKEIEPIVLSMGAGRPADPALRDEYRRLVVELKGTKR
ncbi:MAG: DNA primase [Elusimicrobia bacterium]|nr:DNA primase [Elusimicrobiota bacterium]